MRIYGHRATVTHRLLLALFVIISIFLAIDPTPSSVTIEELLHAHLLLSSLLLSFLTFVYYSFAFIWGPELAIE